MWVIASPPPPGRGACWRGRPSCAMARRGSLFSVSADDKIPPPRHPTESHAKSRRGSEACDRPSLEGRLSLPAGQRLEECYQIPPLPLAQAQGPEHRPVAAAVVERDHVLQRRERPVVH